VASMVGKQLILSQQLPQILVMMLLFSLHFNCSILHTYHTIIV
jgi:hypothetical protein